VASPPEVDWREEAYRILKSELVRRKISYKELARSLEKIGVTETERSIANKISRGTFSFQFVLQCMRAIGVQWVNLCPNEPSAAEARLRRHTLGGKTSHRLKKDSQRKIL
jgi:hypothetical protein